MTETNNVIAAIVLAGGQSLRFNGIKQLADIHGQTMLNHSLSHIPIAPKHIYIVLGAHFDAIHKTLKNEYNIIKNQQWNQGVASSIKAAINAISHQYTHILITLADQVALKKHHYSCMLDAVNQDNTKIVAASYTHSSNQNSNNSKSNGAPAIFPKTYFPKLLTLKGDIGAKKILNNEGDNVVAININEAQEDIDTHEQWVSWTTQKHLRMKH